MTIFHTTTTGSADHRFHLETGWRPCDVQTLRHLGLTSLSRAMCPVCGAVLQRLTGRDGWGVETTVDDDVHRRQIERRMIATVHACPRCEHCE